MEKEAILQEIYKTSFGVEIEKLSSSSDTIMPILKKYKQFPNMTKSNRSAVLETITSPDVLKFIYESNHKNEIEKMGSSLGMLSRSVSGPGLVNFFKRKSLKKSINSALKRADTKIKVLSRDQKNLNTSQKLFTALKNIEKRRKVISGL